ncbi:MAG: hypothetical protein IPO27_05615 [Bacteroidetes bacterium]|nr:hypothetical protein [Bacteroidota bacterium]
MLLIFCNGIPVNNITNNRNLNFLQTNSVMADSSGNILFASNGLFIKDKNDSTMLGGDSINLSSIAYTSSYISTGWSGTQFLVTIPYPGKAHDYLMFNTHIKDDPGVYFVNVVDYHHISMDSAGGLGEVVSHNNLVLADTLTEAFFSAVKHGNGRDWWIVKPQLYTNKYFKFLVTPTGISTGMQNIGAPTESPTYEGQSSFSQDGHYYARIDWITDPWTFDGQLVVMELDICTGDFSNVIVDTLDSAAACGVAFSPNGKYMYVSTYLHIYQYTLQVGPNMINTKKIIATYDGYVSPQPYGFASFWQMFMGPDKKIYCITQSPSDNMTVINQPDMFDTLCDVQPHSFHFGIRNNRTCPNWPNYELGPEPGSPCDTLGLVQAELISNVGLQVFPNPASGFYNIRTTYRATAMPLPPFMM